MEYDLEKMLPHSYPMILIDGIEEIDSENSSVTASVTITENKIFYDKTLGGIDAVVGIEFMAQTIGCCSYFKNSMKKAKIGFLLGTRSYKCCLEKFEKGKTYTIRAHELYSDNELVSYECFIYNEGIEAASAVINAYQPANAEEFLKSGV